MSLLQRPGSRLAISVQRLPYVRCPCKFGQVVAGVSTCCESCACLLWPPGAIWWSAAGACDETPRQQGCILRLPLFVRTSTITATSHSVSGSSHGRLRSGFRKQRHLKGRGVGVGGGVGVWVGVGVGVGWGGGTQAGGPWAGGSRALDTLQVPWCTWMPLLQSASSASTAAPWRARPCGYVAAAGHGR